MDNVSDEKLEQIETDWRIYRSNNWIAKHKATGKVLKAGTRHSLVEHCLAWERITKLFCNGRIIL